MSNEVHVEVEAPREPKPRKFTFRTDEKVGEAARQAGKAFGYPPGFDLTFQKGEKVLHRHETLEAAHVKNGDLLELVDAGGGV